MRKRILSLILALALLVGMVPAVAAAPGKGEILSFDLERTEYTAALGTIQADLGLPALVKATVREQVTTVEIGEDGQTVASTATEETETEIPVTWTCDDYQLAMEGTYTFTARAEGYALADGVKWPSVAVTLEHQLARPWANSIMPMANGDDVAYVSNGATGGTLNSRTDPYGSLAAAITALTNGGTVYVMNDLTKVDRANTSVTKNITIATDPQAGGAATVWTSGRASMFQVSGGATLTIQNLILDGGNTGGNAFIIVGTTTNSLVGHLVLGDGAVIRNCVTNFGAVWTNTNENTSVTLEEGAVISGNTAKTLESNLTPACGGGVTLRGGTLTMNGGAITGNTAQISGGGVYVAAGATFTMKGGQIGGNTAAGNGGGVYLPADGTDGKQAAFTMTGGKIDGNTGSEGGGVYMIGGTFHMAAGAEISGNTAVSTSSYAGGGGVRVDSGSATLAGVISNNDAHDGGGVYVHCDTAPEDAVATVSGYVTGNTADNGAGVYVDQGTATLDGATIIGNTADGYGGGAFLHSNRNGKITLSGKLTILDNISHNASAPEENNLLLFSRTSNPSRFSIQNLDTGSEIGITHVNSDTWNRQEGLFAITGQATGNTETDNAAAAAAEAALACFTSDDPKFQVVEKGRVQDGTNYCYGLSLARVEASAYYVSSTGSDSMPGTREQPYRTLSKAISTAEKVEGATIYVMDDITETLTAGDQVQGKGLTITTDPETLETSGPATVTLAGSGYFIQSHPVSFEGGKTTLRNIIFDGTGRTAAEGQPLYGPFNLLLGTLVLDEGAVIQNFASNTPAVWTLSDQSPKLEMHDGAAIRNNTMTYSSLATNYANAYGGGVGIGGNAAFTMDGGVIDNNQSKFGAAVYMTGGTFTMSEDAVISNNKTDYGVTGTTTSYDGVVTVKGGAADLKGAFTGNVGYDGGAVLVDGTGAEVTLSGTVTGNTSGVAAIYAHNGKLTLDGADIQNNKGKMYADLSGIYVKGDGGTPQVTIQRDTVVKNNTGNAGAPANLSVYETAVSLGAGLTAGADIGVRVRPSNIGIFAGEEGGSTEIAADSVKYFFSDDPKYVVQDNGNGTLSLVYPKNHYYVSNAGNDDTGDGTADKPFLTMDAAFNKASDDGALGDEGGAVIHVMNRVTVDYRILFGEAGQELTVTGTGPDGESYPDAALVGSGELLLWAEKNARGLFGVQESVILNLDHLILDGNSAGDTRAIRASGGTVNLNDGVSITGWKCGENASATYAIFASGTAKFNLSGSVSITGNSGGGIHLGADNTITLSGTPVLKGNTYNGAPSNLWLDRTATGGNMVTVTGALENGSAIGITDGARDKGVVFATSDTTNAAANLDFFFSDDGAWSMVDDGAVLQWTNDPVARNQRTRDTYTTIQEAVDAAQSSDTIELLRDVTAGATVTVANKTFTLTSADGENYTILRSPIFNGNFFQINGGGNVTFQNITLDGNKAAGAAGGTGFNGFLIDLNGGAAILDEGAVLQNNVRTYIYNEGSAVYVRGGGSLEVREGAVIRWNEAQIGAAIAIDAASVNMTGGQITGNYNRRDDSNGSSQTSGVVYLYKTGASFTMTGGSITGNGQYNTGDGWSAAGVGTYPKSNYTYAVTIGGTANITGNVYGDSLTLTGDSYGGGSQANLALTPDTTLTMLNGFTGSVGVSQADAIDGANQPGTTFGAAEANAAGAEHFTNDRNTGLTAALEGANLVWRMSDLYVSSQKGNNDTGLGTEDAPYATLEYAISRAPDGAVIHIMDDVTVTSYNIISKNLTITGTNGSGAPYLGAALTAGGNFHYNNVYGMLQIGAGYTVAVDNLTLNGVGYNTRVARVWGSAKNPGHLSLTDVTATGWGMGVAHVNGTASLSGTVTLTGNGYGIGFGATHAQLTLSGKVVISGNTDAAGNNANVVLSAGRNPETEKQIVVKGLLDSSSSIGVTDGAAAVDVVFAVNDDQSAAQANMDKFFADNGQDIAATDGANLVWGQYVARILYPSGAVRERYTTLQAALDDVLPGQTVELMADVTENAVIGSPFAALDFRGYTVTGALTVSETGNVGVIRNTVDGVQNFVTGGVKNEKNPVTIEAGGTVGEIAGGRYQETATSSPPGSESVSVAGTLKVISGGWFTGVKVAVCLYGDSGASTVITGGVFDAGTDAVVGGYHGTVDLTISGGYFGSREFYYADTIIVNGHTVSDKGWDASGVLDSTAASVEGQGGITEEDNSDLYYPVASDYVARVNNGTGGAWQYYASLKGAVEAVSASGQTVELLKDIELGERIIVSHNFAFTLQSNSDTAATYTVERASGFADHMFTMGSGTTSSVAIQDIILDGGAEWVGTTDPVLGRGTTNNGEKAGTGYILYIAGGSVTLGDGAVVRNNDRTGSSTGYHDSADRGGAVSVQAGTLTMLEGSAIRDSASNGSIGDGAALAVWGGATFNMNGGEITGCYGQRWGAVRNSGTMTMSGDAKITGNMGGQSNGGVFHHGSGTLTISGNANITGNYLADGTPANLYQYVSAADPALAITLGGNFTGSIGVTQATDSDIEDPNAADSQFGVSSGNYAGASNFFSDVNSSLGGVIQASGDNSYILVWSRPVARTSNNGGRTWTYFSSLAGAVEAVDDDPATVSYVEPLTSLTVNSNIATAKTFTLRSYSEGAATNILTRDPSFAGVFFTLNSGADVTIENLALEGNKTRTTDISNVNYMVSVASGAELTLGDGADLRRNACTKGSNTAGAVWVTGTMTMKDGALIRWNEAEYGSAVSVDGGTLNMEGGQITGNYATRYNNSNTGSGAIHVWSSGAEMNMSGGSITGNGAAARTDNKNNYDAGGVILEDGTLTISGDAVIAGNYLTDPTTGNLKLTSGSYTTGTMEANLTLTEDTNQNIVLGGDFNGSVGVTQWPRVPAEGAEATVNIPGAQFGTAGGGFTGAGHFFNDLDRALVGSLSTNESGASILVWSDGGVVARTSNDGGKTWTAFATLQEAVNAADSDPNTVTYVELLRNISLDGTIDTDGKSFTLRSGTRSEDGRYILSRDSGFTDKFLDLAEEETLTVEDLVLDGGGTAKSPLLRVKDGASATLGDGALIQNNQNTGALGTGGENNGGGVLVCGGTLTVKNGAEIRNNSAQYGGGVHVNNGGELNMEGGVIRNNTASQLGGGVGMYWDDRGGATVKLSGGVQITGNTGGGVGMGQTDDALEAGALAVEVAGNVTVTGNTGGNLCLNADAALTLTGDFTGSIGVTEKWDGAQNTSGEQFGLNGGKHAGAGKFTNDSADLVGETTGDGQLVWARGDVVARVNNKADGGWTEYTSLQDAIAAVADGGDTVELLKDITLTETIQVNFNKTFELRSGTRSEDGQYTITRGSTSSTLFTLSNGASVTVTDLILDGDKNRAGASTYMVQVNSGASLTLSDGAILQNNRVNDTGNTAGAVRVLGSLTIQDGAVIRWNEAAYGSAVSAEKGTITMTGGEIYGNYATRAGGAGGSAAVEIWSGGTFDMSGGAITGNGGKESSTGAAGGVFVESGTFKVRGGALITGNFVCENQKLTNPPAVSGDDLSGEDVVDRYVEGTIANVTLYNNQKITLTGDFTGSMGVTQWPLDTVGHNQAGDVFGAVEGAGNYTGAENFLNDYTHLRGEVNGTDVRWKFIAVARVNHGDGGWTEYGTLADAIKALETKGGDTVELLRNVTESATISSSENFTLRSSTKEEDAGKTFTVKRGAAVTLFDLSGSVTMTNITLDGGAVYGTGDNWYSSVSGVYGGSVMVKVNESGSLTLDAGATLQNAARPGPATYGAALQVNGGSVTVNDGAAIKNNMVATTGPAIYATGAAKVTIEGGEISHNACSASQGIVTLSGSSALTMTGGAVKNNYGRWAAAAIYPNGSGNVVELSGGEITGNKSGTNRPAGIWTNANCRITLSGSITIKDNVNNSNQQYNLSLPSDTMLTIRGELTGQVGITDGWAGAQNVSGEYFGLGIDAAGLTALFNDRDENLDATLDGGRVKWDNSQVAMIVGGRDNGKTYSTLAAAIADYDADATHIVMIANSTEAPITVDKTVYVNLDGYTVTADVKVDRNMTFYGFDTKTNGFDCKAGTAFGHIIGTVSGLGTMAGVTNTSAAQTETAMRYVKVTEATEGRTDTSFHRFDSKLGTVYFRPRVAGIYFVTTFYGDQWVKDALQEGGELSYGIFLTLDDTATSPEDGNTASAAHDPNGFQTGKGGDRHQGSMIQYIVMETLPGAENQERTDTEIYVSTYFSFEDAGVAADIMRSVTLTKIVSLAADQYNRGELSEAQAADFEAFWEKFSYLYPDISVTKKQDLTDGGDEA